MSKINLAKITQARQITIPKEICEHLKLTPGDQLLLPWQTMVKSLSLGLKIYSKVRR